MKRLRVPLGDRSYSIYIGSGAIQKLPQWLKKKKSKRAFVISDERLLRPRKKLRSTLRKAGWEVHEFPVRAGEGLKDFSTLFPLYGKLLKARADRHSSLFALGGGSVGDAVGFVASTYLRGISWISLPTTLLAQVDSSVGGKTGINHPAGKNLIGTFHQPELVVCDTDFLATLSKRERISGVGEMIKIALTYDPQFYMRLEKKIKKLLSLDPRFLVPSIQMALKWKCKAVARDEQDRTGIREVLNFGHTFGHALESITKYRVFQHGEAVLWGMRFALALSQVRQKITPQVCNRVDSFLASLPVPSLPRNFGFGEFFESMKRDKKTKNGKVRFVLLKGLGKAILDHEVEETNLREAYQLMCAQTLKGDSDGR